MTPKLYRKRPIVVEAMGPLTPENIQEIAKWCNGDAFEQWITVHTLEGQMIAKPSDYIIKGVKGEFYPCDLEVFKQSYDEMPEPIYPLGEDK